MKAKGPRSGINCELLRISMKIKLSIFLIATSSFITSVATAQNKPYACQEDAVAGLIWENSRWVTSRFNENKFILVMQGQILTIESVAKALQSPPSQVSCRNINPEILCSNVAGRIIYFNTDNQKGTMSRNFGGTMPGNEKDSLTISAFSCTQF